MKWETRMFTSNSTWQPSTTTTKKTVVTEYDEQGRVVKVTETTETVTTQSASGQYTIRNAS